jgi:hypothetical protein
MTPGTHDARSHEGLASQIAGKTSAFAGQILLLGGLCLGASMLSLSHPLRASRLAAHHSPGSPAAG